MGQVWNCKKAVFKIPNTVQLYRKQKKNVFNENQINHEIISEAAAYNTYSTDISEVLYLQHNSPENFLFLFQNQRREL